MHEIRIWYNRKIELNIWYRNLCLQLQRSDVSCSSWPGLHTLHKTYAGLNRRTLRALQDFNQWRCSVLLMVTVETVVPALFRSLTRSSRVVLGWSLTFLRIIDTPRGEILQGAPVRGRLTVILNFFHFLIIAPTVVAFSALLFAYCPVAHPSLVQVYNFVPSVLRQLFSLAHRGEVGVWLIECVNRGLLYRCN